jgi:hypothetical protein
MIEIDFAVPTWFWSTIPQELALKQIQSSEENSHELCKLLSIQLGEYDISAQNTLIRGGFSNEESVNLLREFGWDYQGREKVHKPRDMTYATPFYEMSTIHLIEKDPALNPLFHAYLTASSPNSKGVLAIYDETALTLAPKPYEAQNMYIFNQPDKKKDALLAIVNLIYR